VSKLSISKQLASLMKEHGVSQSGLSRGCGVPQPTINRILNEKTREPRRDSVLRIAKFFDVSVESLYKEADESEEPTDILSRTYQQIMALRPDQRKKLVAKVLECDE